MKIAYLLSFSLFVGLMTSVVGAVVTSEEAPVSVKHQSGTTEVAMLTKLNTQPTFSDSTLRRPF